MKDNSLRYRATKRDCGACPLKPRCCPNTPARKIPRSIHEGARDLARDIAKTEAYQISRHQRKKVEMLFAHLKRILKLDRLRLRGPNGARDEFHLAATAQNLRKAGEIDPDTDAIPELRGGHPPPYRIPAPPFPSGEQPFSTKSPETAVSQGPGAGKCVMLDSCPEQTGPDPRRTNNEAL